MKKILLLIFLSVFCINAINAEVTWELSEEGTLTISGTNMPNYSNFDPYFAPWYSQCEKIKKVVINNGVTNIGNMAFFLCSGLSSVTIPNSVTSIGQSAFYGCSSLTSISIPNSVTRIEDQVFYECSSLTSVTIPNSVTSIGIRTFTRCSDLTSITVEKGNPQYDSRNNCNAIIETESNTLITGCNNTTIPNSVTNIGKYAFFECFDLTSVSIPNSVTSIGDHAFCGCTSLVSIIIPNSVTSIGNSAFSTCRSLTSIIIPNSVTFIGDDTFSFCESLKSISIPNSVTEIGFGAFNNCSGLASIIIPNSVTSIGNHAFSNCSNIASITVEKGNSTFDSRNDCNAIIETASNTLITGCKNTIIPNSVTSIGLSAFEGCSGLTSVVIPNSVTSIEREAFWCCNLQSITIPSSVTNIGKEAFHGCSSPTSITVEKGNTCYDSRNNCNAIIETESNTLIFGCRNTIIPNSVTSIGDFAFFACYYLTSITIPNSVTSIGYHAFENCLGMKSVYIPNSVTNIGNGAFIYCRGLTSITCEANTPPTISLYGACFVDVNKSIPVYVPANSVAQYKVANEWKDFVNLQAISTTYALIDGESYNNNSQIEGYDISYTRNFTNTKWQALYIPFSMSYDDWKNDFDIAYINGIRQYDMNDDGAIDETIMDVIKIKHGSLIPNTPYLIRAKTTGEKTITVNNATLYKAEENSIDCRTTIAEYTFTGTYSTIPASTLIVNNYYAMGDGSMVITDGTSDLKPYRWYMRIDARSPMYNVSLDAKTITINVIGDEEPTGVCQLRMTDDELPVYDLNGRRVNEKSLKPGIYVKNGKKVIIK